MLFFWENVTRYPKFLITGVLGLVTIILAPLEKVRKNSNTLFIVFVLSGVLLLFVIFQQMLDL